MNCQGIRRQILADPQHLAHDVLEHVDTCVSCRAYLDSVKHNDELIRSAFSAPRSEGLQERLIAEAGFDRSRRRFGLALAAGIVAVGVPGAIWLARSQQSGGQAWASAMLEHLKKDPQHLYSADPEAPQHLERVLSSLGGRRVDELPTVIRADRCTLMGESAAHVVFEMKGERAVSFLVAQELEPAILKESAWCAELRRVPGGTIGVFASNEECVSRLGNALSTGIELQVS